MACCKRCGAPLAQINGRTLKEALVFTQASFPIKGFSSTDWVQVCPICDAYALGAETKHPWPFQSEDGVMRVVDDYEQGVVSDRSKCLSFCGFKFTDAALRSADELLDSEGETTRALESIGASLSSLSDQQEFLQFSRGVCEWGRGQRVWGNLLRHHSPDQLGHQLREWLVYAMTSNDDERVIAQGMAIKGFGVSFASKHLRLLDPERYAVLDDVLRQGLGIALNPRGYRLFLSALRGLSGELEKPFRIANLEAAVFLLVRQAVRAKI